MKNRNQRLIDAFRWSRSRLKYARLTRKNICEQIGGRHYSEGYNDRVPANYLELTRTIFLNNLIASPPEAMVSTAVPGLKPAALDFEAVLNMCIKRSGMYDILRACVDDALVGMGIVRLGLVKAGDLDDGYGGTVEYGRPGLFRVDLDDWVHDMTASRWETVAYMGHRYAVELEAAKAEDSFEKKERDKLSTVERPDSNEDGDQRIVNLQTGGEQDDTVQDRDYTELWDIYYPKEQKVCTYAATVDGISGVPLREMEWRGPGLGPYHRLCYGEMPGNTLPLPPAYSWLDIHELVNPLLNKCGDQAERQRTIFGYRGGTSTQDARNIMDAMDGEWRKLMDPNGVVPFQVPGVDPNTLAFVLNLQNMYSWLTGNLDALGGLSPQSETVGQDRLLAQAASKRVQAMNMQTLAFTTRLVEEYATYVWEEPVEDFVTERSVPGFRTGVPVRMNAGEREGKFPDYDISIVPISMHRMTPNEEVQAMMQVWERIVLPAMPVLEAQGVRVKVEDFLRHLARRGKWDWLDDMLEFTGMPSESAPKARGSSGMPAQTNRTYTRVNRPGATRENSNSAMIQHLMGRNQQPAEAAAAFRRVS